MLNSEVIFPPSPYIHLTGSASKQVGLTKNSYNLMFWRNTSTFDDITCTSDHRITSCKYSKFKVLNVNSTTRAVDVGIYLYDRVKKRKTNGGDVILMWAEKQDSSGYVAGHVTDQMNGSYHGRVILPWSGETRIYVKLVSAKENLCLRFKAMERYGTSVFAGKTPHGIHYRFMNGSIVGFTRCVPHSFVYGYTSICNFTNLNFGYSWFCGKPTTQGLNCISYNQFRMRPYNVSEIDPTHSQSEIIQVPGHCTFKQMLSVVMEGREKAETIPKLPKCTEIAKRASWTENHIPSGYAINGTWRSLSCSTTFELTKTDITRCLKGKRLFFIGDSTLEQYFDVLVKHLKIKPKSYQFYKVAASEEYNIHLSCIKHEMPFHKPVLNDQHKVQATDFNIDKLANDTSINGSSLILVIHYGAHLQAYPPNVYRSRIRSLFNALRRLLIAKPEVTVMVKGSAPVILDTHWFDVRISLMFDEILFEEFSTLKDHVVYLDVYSIFVSFGHNALHPSGLTLQNVVHQFMSYIC